MTLDPTITFGALLNAIVFIVGFTVAFTKIGGRIDLLAQRLGAVEATLLHQRDVAERLGIIEARQSSQGQTLAATQTEIADLRRGRGFIRGEANGEYP